jgi:hypothetical protein
VKLIRGRFPRGANEERRKGLIGVSKKHFGVNVSLELTEVRRRFASSSNRSKAKVKAKT